MAEPFAVGLLAGAVVGWVLKPNGQVQAVTQPTITDYLKTETPSLIEALSLDTTQVRNTEEYDLVGSCIFIENPTDCSQPVYIRLNEKDAPQMELTSKKKITGQFYRFFIDNVAGTGTLNLKISRAEIFDFQDAKVQVNITNSNISVNITNSSINMKLTGSDIMMPIDIQSSYIMMPVDIQAQYMNLAIDIKAQTIGNLTIDIAAQSIGQLNVNIKASDITLNVTVANASINVAVTGTANISITAQSIGILLQPEYASHQGTDKNVSGYASIGLNTGAYVVTYTVPTGKICYVTQFGAVWYLSSPTASIGGRALLECPGATVVAMVGGENGASFVLSKPVKATAGQTIRVYVLGHSATSGILYGVFNGYEVLA